LNVLAMSGLPDDSLVLASASPSRATVMRNAGLTFAVEPSECDEDDIKQRMQADGASAAAVAEALAAAKAEIISARHPRCYVVAADQMMVCAGEWFDKPRDLAEAKTHLERLRGKTHALVSATVVYRNGEGIWRHGDEARLTMRDLSDDFIAAYIDSVGEMACRSVGAYQLEGPGAQLFAKVEGDFFSILGLPLLPLLDFLRDRNLVPS
jgi:septum formation protein